MTASIDKTTTSINHLIFFKAVGFVIASVNIGHYLAKLFV